jgi:hypothetical protein
MIALNTTILLRLLGLLALGLGPSLAPGAAVAPAPSDAESAFACNLKALTPAERATHRQLTERLLPAVRGTREIAEGYVFELDARQVAIADLAAWVDFERRCCPFFDFHLEWRRENGPVTLQLTGREGVKAFIQAEFKAAFR